MKYFKLKNNFDRTNEIGEYPQVESLFKFGDIFDIQDSPQIRNGPIDFEWALPEPILLPKAKPTTMIGGGAISSLYFLILKDSFVNFLKNYELEKFNQWPIKVHHKNRILEDYVLFHLSHTSEDEIIDYTNSIFFIGEQSFWEDQSVGEQIKINRYEDYINLNEVLTQENKGIRIQCPKLILDFHKTELDMFRLADIPFGSGYYVSERLKNAIEEKGFTGMDFVEIEEHSKRIKVKNTGRPYL